MGLKHFPYEKRLEYLRVSRLKKRGRNDQSVYNHVWYRESDQTPVFLIVKTLGSEVI